MTIHVPGKQIEIKTGVVVAGVSILILVGCLVGYIFFRDTSDIIIEAGAERVETEVTTVITSNGALQNDMEVTRTTGQAVTAKEEIKVYVVGCVKKPGIVTLEKGQMIDDAVKLAGGLTEEAEAGSINMVYELNENTMLYIKSKSELEQKQVSGEETGKSSSSGKNGAIGSAGTKNAASSRNAPITSAIGSNNNNNGLGEGAALIRDSGSSVDIVSSNSDNVKNSENTGNVKININTADSAELDTLPGVGEATARDIISFREKNGPFNKIEDIMKVPRIKQNRFESIQELICVE